MLVSQCLFCDHDNPPGAKFCNECGSPLHLRPCWQCNAINDVASESCYKCGAAYAPASPSSAGDAPTPVETDLPDPSLAATATATTTTLAASDSGRAVRGSRSWRRLAVALPPLALLGIVAIGSYLAYRDPERVREWLSTAKAMVAKDRDVAAAPYELPKHVALASPVGPSSAAASSIATDAPATPLAVDPPASDSSPPSASQDGAAGSPPNGATKDATPGQVTTTSGTPSSAADQVASANADKTPASKPKTRAKKSKKPPGKKQPTSQVKAS